MAHIFINSDLLEGIESEISWVAPMGIRPPGILAAWSQELNGSVRPLLGECVDRTTASQTVGRTLPPVRRHGDSPSVHGHKMRMHQTGATSTLEVQ